MNKSQSYWLFWPVFLTFLVKMIWWICDLLWAATSTDFCNRLTVPPNSNRIRLTERFASPYGALCFHVFMSSDSPPGPSRLSLQVVSLLVSNQTIFTQIKRQSKIITCSVLMHKNKSQTFFFFFFFHKTLFHIIYIFWQCILTVSMSTSCCWYIIFTLSGQNTVSNKCHIVIQISIL